LADVSYSAWMGKGSTQHQHLVQTEVPTVRDQNTFGSDLRKKRLMTLNHLFLVHRCKIRAVHYVRPTDDNNTTG
jgi:hypothetical protein